MNFNKLLIIIFSILLSFVVLCFFLVCFPLFVLTTLCSLMFTGTRVSFSLWRHKRREQRFQASSLKYLFFVLVSLNLFVKASYLEAQSLSADHTIDRSNHFAAQDLEHGQGSARLSVQRVWFGRNTLNSHFGQGWSDFNVVRLARTSPDSLLVWRGGIGWIDANKIKDEKEFSSDGGIKITQTVSGWILKSVDDSELTFDSDGRLQSARSIGEVINYAYDSKGRLEKVDRGAGNVLQYRYKEGENRVSQTIGPEGLQASYEYDTATRLKKVKNQRGIVTEYSYDKDGELLAAKDNFGVSCSVKELLNPNLAGKENEGDQRKDNTPSLLSVPKVVFDQRGLPQKASFLGEEVNYTYDGNGQLQSINSTAAETKFRYDNFGRVSESSASGGPSVMFQYNPLGLVTKRSEEWEENLRYDSFGRLVAVERSDGSSEAFSFDDRGRLIATKSSDRPDAEYSYDTNSNNAGDRLTEARLSDGSFVRYGYDSSGRLNSRANNGGSPELWSYDQTGRVADTEDAYGNKTSYVYDTDGRVVQKVSNVEGKTVFKRSDNTFAIESEVLGNWKYSSDSLGRVTNRLSPGAGETTYTYGNRLDPEKVITPSKNAWSYRYGLSGKLEEIKSPSGLLTSIAFDAGGRVASVIRADLQWRKYAYDEKGRLIEERNGADQSLHLSYNEDGSLKKITAPGYEHSIEYDRAKNILRVTGDNFQLIEEHGKESGLKSRKYLSGGKPIMELKLLRDKFGRAGGIEFNKLKVNYLYNKAGDVEFLVLPKDRKIEITRDKAGREVEFKFSKAVNLGLSYDSAGRVLRIKSSQQPKPLINEGYRYDTSGNLNEIEADEGSRLVFSYDVEGQLSRVSDTKAVIGEKYFYYDLDGNLTTPPSGEGLARWSLDKLGRPLKQKGLEYEWDKAGRLAISRSSAGVVENKYLAGDLLSERRIGDAKWSYGYLYNGDRLWQESGAGRIWYAYLPEGLVGFLDESNISWLLISLPGSDRPLALVNSKGEQFYALTDHLGSVRRWVDADGKVVSSTDFGPFGVIAKKDGSDLPRIYAGLLRDQNGLYYARARYYDPHLARFITPDPELGSPYNPATHGIYTYALNNPYRYRDPSGASPVSDIANLNNVQLLAHASNASSAADRAQAVDILRARAEARAMVDAELRVARTAARQAVDPRAFAVTVGTPVDPRAFAVTVGKPVDPRAFAVTVGTPVDPRAFAVTQVTPSLGYRNPRAGSALGAGAAHAGASTVGRIATGIGLVVDLISIAQASYEGIRLNQAINGRDRAQQLSQQMLEQIRSRLASSDNTSRLLTAPGGRLWNPNDPEDLQLMVNMVSQNITNNQPVFTGVLQAPTQDNPQRTAAMREAVRQCSFELQTAGRRRAQIEEATVQLNAKIAEIKGQLQLASSILVPLSAPFSRVAEAARAAAELRDALKATDPQLAILQAVVGTAKTVSDQAIACKDKVCGFLSTISKANSSEIEKAKGEFAALISSSHGALSDLIVKANAIAINPDNLLLSANRLSAFSADVDLVLGGSALTINRPIAEAALKFARELAIPAQQLQADIETWKGELKNIPERVRAVMEPHIWSEETVSCMASVSSPATFASATLPAGASDYLATIEFAEILFSRVLEQASAIEKGAAGLSDLKALVASAQTAAAVAEPFLQDLRELELGARAKDIESAKNCLHQIESDNPSDTSNDDDDDPDSDDLDSDDPDDESQDNDISDSDDEEIEVPDLAALGEVAAMRAEVTKRELVFALAPADELTPSKDKEFKLQKQAPAAGSKLEKQETVTAYIYAEYSAQSSDLIVPGIMPNLVGKELDAGLEILKAANLESGGVLTGIKPPDAEHAYLISGTTPAAGSALDLKTKPYIEIRIYGPYESTTPATPIPAATINGDPYQICAGDYTPQEACRLRLQKGVPECKPFQFSVGKEEVLMCAKWQGKCTKKGSSDTNPFTVNTNFAVTIDGDKMLLAGFGFYARFTPTGTSAKFEQLIGVYRTVCEFDFVQLKGDCISYPQAGSQSKDTITEHCVFERAPK